MKKILLMFSIIIGCLNSSHAQVISRDAQIKPAAKPVNNPNQLPNYYQNNSSYNNNSMQNNKPDNSGSYPGNGTYVDPTRHPAGTYMGSSSNQLPQQGPVNSTNSNGVHATTGK